jgi:hypothetical protein
MRSALARSFSPAQPMQLNTDRPEGLDPHIEAKWSYTMQPSLQQKLLFAKETYTIDFNGVRIQEMSINKNVEGLIPFEQIPMKRYFRRRFRPGAIILCMVFSVFNFFLILGQIGDPKGYTQPNTAIASLLMIVIPVAIIWFSRYEYIGYGMPGNGIVFKANRPSRQAVETFMQQIHTAKVAYLRDMYIDKAKELPIDEELRRLIWLKELGAIEFTEFEERRAQLSIPSTYSGIGFHRN